MAVRVFGEKFDPKWGEISTKQQKGIFADHNSSNDGLTILYQL